jgi:hypothetical protein
MDFFFNSFMTVLGGLAALAVVFFVWNMGPLVIVSILPKIISKEKQAQFMVDLKKNPWQNAKVLRVARKWGWHEEE